MSDLTALYQAWRDVVDHPPTAAVNHNDWIERCRVARLRYAEAKTGLRIGQRVVLTAEAKIERVGILEDLRLDLPGWANIATVSNHVIPFAWIDVAASQLLPPAESLATDRPAVLERLAARIERLAVTGDTERLANAQALYDHIAAGGDYHVRDMTAELIDGLRAAGGGIGQLTRQTGLKRARSRRS